MKFVVKLMKLNSSNNKWGKLTKIITYSIIIISLLIITIHILPKPPLLSDISFSTAVYDDNNHLLRLTLTTDEKYRLFTPLNKISPQVINATLLQEDQYFRYHPGINPLALVKAAWKTYAVKERRIGGSTITMQVVRMRYHITSKTLPGKLWQILYALELELFYSKDQILEAYLNLASYGGNIEGIGTASLIYFNKPLQQLSLPEILSLVIIPQNPLQKSFSAANQTLIKESRDHLFSEWLVLHPKDKDQTELMTLPLQAIKRRLPFIAPHFVTTVLQKPNAANQPIITTGLDLPLQKTLQTTLQRYLQQKHNVGINNAAAMLIDVRDMEVKALVGSGDFFNDAIEGQINGTHIKRSPGSTLKPFIYALAFDQGLIHPNSILKDAPTDFGAYSPDNFDYDFMGPISAKNALILSRNIPAIALATQLSHPDLYQFLQSANIRQLKPESYYGLSLVLGGAQVSMDELVSLYATLANGGIWKPLRYKTSDPIVSGTRLLSPEASFLTLDILKNTNRPQGYFEAAYNQRSSVAWKTGTSSAYRDAWTVGVFGPYVLAVWIGNFDASSNPMFVGKDSAAPLFFDINDAIETQYGPLPSLTTDPNKLHLTQVDVCEASGALPTAFCPHTVKTWFIPGKSPIKTDTVFRQIMIDSKTGLRACKFDPNNTFEVYEFWPSDLLKIFQQAGLQRPIPPAFDADCNLATAQHSESNPPQITSPHKKLIYTFSIKQTYNTIPFTAIGDADVKTFYWFVDQTFVGKSTPNHPLLWLAKPGDFTIRVADDFGRSDAVQMKVETVM